MTFQEGIRYFAMAPFNPKKELAKNAALFHNRERMNNFVLTAVFVWFMALYMLLYFREVQNYSYMMILFSVIPVVVGVYGPVITVQMFSSMFLPEHVPTRTLVSLLLYSFLPNFIGLIGGYFIPEIGQILFYGCLAWTGFIMVIGLTMIERIEMSKAITIVVLGLIAVRVVLLMFNRFLANQYL